MIPTIIQQLKSTMFCAGLNKDLNFYENTLTESDKTIDNTGIFSPDEEVKDIKAGNDAILLYIDSLRGKKRCITPAEISEELGYSEHFVESILIANGFQED